MTDYSSLDAAVSKIRAKNPGIAACFDEVEKILKGAGTPPPPPPPPPSGTTIFQVDYNTQDFSVWDVVSKDGAGGSASLVADPAGSGLRVARLSIPAFTSASQHGRVEPTKIPAPGSPDGSMRSPWYGKVVTFSGALYVDPATVWADANSWNVLYQWKINNPDLVGLSFIVDPRDFAVPHFVFRVLGGRDVTMNTQLAATEHRIDCLPVVKGVWIQFDFTVFWADDLTGWVEVRRDGALVAPRVNHPTTVTEGGVPVMHKLSQELYCGPSLPSPQTVFFKGLRVTV